MHIITGQLRGRVFPYKPRRHGEIRLTSSRLKEALFSMLGAQLHPRTFLDLCAGCGQIGLEAYSRGARVTMNEPDARRFSYLKKLLREWRVELLELHRMKAQLFISLLQEQERQFDIIYLDPPYHARLRNEPLSLALLQQTAAADLLSREGQLFVQHPGELQLPEQEGCLYRTRLRHYGRTALSQYCANPPLS